MKQQLLDWWKGTFTKDGWSSSGYRISLNGDGDFNLYLPSGVYWRSCQTKDQAYESSLIHYLNANKGLLRIVFHDVAKINFTGVHSWQKYPDFVSWFKEVTE